MNHSAYLFSLHLDQTTPLSLSVHCSTVSLDFGLDDKHADLQTLFAYFFDDLE